MEVCILAGGLSTRLGRDKARLRLGGRSLLAHAKAAAAVLNCPMRVIRRDVVPGCGPLGGIFTALKTARAQSVVFFACDMPFVPRALLLRVLSALRPRTRGVFVAHRAGVGFPFLLRIQTLPQVQALLNEERFALHTLARTLKARLVRPTRREVGLTLNVNTPEDWMTARELWKRSRHNLR